MKKYINKIICDDAVKFLPNIKDNSIDLILTDPPYFLDKMDKNWNIKKVHNKKNLKVVTSLPAGMKFDKNQGKEFYKWYLKISKECFRVLKPGGFFFSFSSPRLYHRMASAMDDAGLDIRDCFIWLYTQNQAKAMSLHHFVNKMKLSKKEKDIIHKKIKDWKTPQVKNCHEPIAMAQKPPEQTFLENHLKHQVSLINTKTKQGKSEDMFPSNVMTSEYINSQIDKVFLVGKPSILEKGSFNKHKTVKPLSLCEYLIRLTTQEKSLVLDPFIGSGTTAVACKNLNRNFIGIESNQEYVNISLSRLKKASQEKSKEQYSKKDQNADQFNLL